MKKNYLVSETIINWLLVPIVSKHVRELIKKEYIVQNSSLYKY